jgi:hypothetical protein
VARARLIVKRKYRTEYVSLSFDKNTGSGHYKYMNNAMTVTAAEMTEYTTDELVAFASAVKTAAAARNTAKYYGEMAFISSIKAEWFPRSDAHDFAVKLVACLQAGLLRLSRADLVGAMDGTMVMASEVTYQRACWHFVVV